MDLLKYFKSPVPKKIEEKTVIILFREKIYEYLFYFDGTFALYTIIVIIFVFVVYFFTRCIRNRRGPGLAVTAVKSETSNKTASSFRRWYDYLGKTSTIRRANWKIFLRECEDLGKKIVQRASSIRCAPPIPPVDVTESNITNDISHIPPEEVFDASLVPLLTPAAPISIIVPSDNVPFIIHCVVHHAPEIEAITSIRKFSPDRNDNAVALAPSVAIVSGDAPLANNIKRLTKMTSPIRPPNPIIGKMDGKLMGSKIRASSLPRVATLNSKQLAITSRNRPASAIVPTNTQISIPSEARRVTPKTTDIIKKYRVNTTTTRGVRAIVPRNGSAIVEDKKTRILVIEKNIPPNAKTFNTTSLALSKGQPTQTTVKHPKAKDVVNLVRNKVEQIASGDGNIPQSKNDKVFLMRRKDVQNKEMVVPGKSKNAVVGDTVGTITNTIIAVPFDTAKPAAREQNLVTSRMSGVASERKRVPSISRRTASVPRCAEVILVNNRMVTAPFRRAATLLGFQPTPASISANTKKSSGSTNSKLIASAQGSGMGECPASAALATFDDEIVSNHLKSIISHEVRDVIPKKISIATATAIRTRAVTPNTPCHYLRRDPKTNNETTERNIRKIRSAGRDSKICSVIGTLPPSTTITATPATWKEKPTTRTDEKLYLNRVRAAALSENALVILPGVDLTSPHIADVAAKQSCIPSEMKVVTTDPVFTEDGLIRTNSYRSSIPSGTCPDEDDETDIMSAQEPSKAATLVNGNVPTQLQFPSTGKAQSLTTENRCAPSICVRTAFSADESLDEECRTTIAKEPQSLTWTISATDFAVENKPKKLNLEDTPPPS